MVNDIQLSLSDVPIPALLIGPEENHANEAFLILERSQPGIREILLSPPSQQAPVFGVGSYLARRLLLRTGAILMLLESDWSLDALPHPSFLLCPEGRIIERNESAKEWKDSLTWLDLLEQLGLRSLNWVSSPQSTKPQAFEDTCFSPTLERWLTLRGLPTGKGILVSIEEPTLKDIETREAESTFLLNQVMSDGLQIGTWIIELESFRLKGNAQFYKLLAIERPLSGFATFEEGMGAILEEDLPGIIQAVRSGIAQNNMFTGQFRLREHPERWLKVHGRCNTNQLQGVTRLAGIVLSTEADTLQPNQFEHLANSIPQMAWIANKEGELLWTNSRWQFFTGETHLMRAHPFRDLTHLIPEPELSRIRITFDTAIQNGHSWEATFRMRSRHGELRMFLVRAVPIRSNRGAIVQWIGTHTDVTEQHSLFEALEISQAEFKAMAESIPYGIWRMDAMGFMDYVSPELLKFSGLTLQEMKEYKWLLALPPKDRERISLIWKKNRQNKKPIEVEFDYFAASGEKRALLGFIRPVFAKENFLKCWIGLIVDVTSRKELENALRSAIRARDDFIAVASHELKTPVTSLMMQIQTLIRDHTKNRLPEGRKERLLVLAEQQTRILSRLVTQLLDASRISAGNMSYDFREVNLSRLLEDCSERYQEALNSVNITLDVSLEPDIHITLDPERMEQVMANLYHNLLRYAPNAPAKLSLERTDGGVLIELKDSGPGIPTSQQSRIFGRFERGQHQDGRGLGLGLYLCREIIQIHHGDISVASSPGEGTTFSIHLPNKILPETQQ